MMNKIFKNESSLFGKIEKLFWTLYSKESFRFLIAGGINTVLGMVGAMLMRALFVSLNWNAKIEIPVNFPLPNWDIPYLIVFVLLLPVAYTFQALIAFQTKWSLKRMLVYPVSSIPNFICQELFIWLFEGVIGLSANWSYFLSPICSLPIMFFIIRFLVKPKKKPMERLNEITSIFCDIDGTLANSKSRLDEETIASVKRIKDNKNFFLVSGRNFGGMKKIYDQLDLGTTLICSNGALITDANKNVIKSYPLPKQIACDIFEEFKESEYSVSIFDEFNWYVNKRNKYTKIEENIVEMEAKEIDDAKKLNNIIKVMLIADETIIDKLYPALKQKYKEVLVKRSKPTFIEISSKDIDKGIAIHVLRKALGLKKKNCMSFGDSILDIPMFRECSINVLMANANDDIKAKADIIAESNDNHGVKNILDKLN